MKTQTEYKIQGMTCEACARRIEKKLNKLDGIKAQVSFATESAILEFQGNPDLAKISEVLEEMGYKLILEDSNFQEVSSISLWISGICTFILLVPMFLMLFQIHIHIPAYIQIILTFIVMLSVGKNFFKSAFYTILDKSTNMDVLVSLGSISAFLLSCIQLVLDNQNQLYFESTASILSFVGFGKYLERKAKYKTSDLFQKLIESLPNQARVFREGSWKLIQIKEVKVGEKIQVLAGEKIPCDSKIVEGQANIEESIFTGESVPSLKQKTDTVLAGSLCLDGVLVLEILSETSKLEKSFYLLKQALLSKPKIQVLVDKVSSIFVPFVLLVSFITLLVWSLTTQNLVQGILAAISVLVISCPCALGLATPTALLVGNSIALEKGILFRNSETLENLEKLEILFWDKTGTLTKGKPIVINVSNSDLSSKEKEILNALVSSNTHPFSKAIHAFYNFSESKLQLENVQVLAGIGIQAYYEGKKYSLVSEKYLKENQISFSSPYLENPASYFLCNTQILSVYYFSDEIRKEAKQVIQSLNDMKIESRILSGDKPKVVQEVAKRLGINSAIGSLSPEEKKLEIQKELENGKIVGMVGDGINDIHALVHANVSFSLSTGTEISKEASDVTITKDDLLLILKSIQLGRKILQKIKQNLFYAFLYNSICIPLAAFGYLNPILAGTAMSLSSVSVVLNSLLLKREN